jgi:type II secretory pathway component GspD/PulD (secretin)
VRVRSPIIAGKRTWRLALCALCVGVCILSVSLHGVAQEQVFQSGSAGTRGVSGELSAALVRPGDLMLRQTDLSAALLMISEIWEINVVLGPDVTGGVYAQFVATPLHEILDAILLPNGLGYRPMGQSLVIMDLERLGDLNPMFDSAAFRLQNVDPAEILESVRLLGSPQGKAEAISSAGTLMVVDFPDRLARIRQFLEEMDRAAVGSGKGPVADGGGPLVVASFAPEFIAAASLQAAVETVLSADGKVAVVEPDGRLVVTDHQERVELVRQVVNDLDIPRRQVRITALIYDLSIEDIERLGINWKSDVKWRHNDEDLPNNVFNIDSLLSVPVAAGTPDGTMAFMSLSRNFDITAVVKALQEATDSRLLADPNVTVLDHENAQMSIIKEIPYQELTQTSAGGQIGTTAFREAGIKLEVTPHIASDGTIRMEVMPSFSRLTGFTPGAEAQPIIDRREASTVVRVADRQVLVIGGLRERSDTGDFNGLPYLKDIKTFNLGALFRGRETSIRESELVVFIMPEIISTSHAGSCREAAALDAGRQLLDLIPVADTDPPPERPIPRCPAPPIGPCRPSYTPYICYKCGNAHCQDHLVRLPPIHTCIRPGERSTRTNWIDGGSMVVPGYSSHDVMGDGPQPYHHQSGLLNNPPYPPYPPVSISLPDWAPATPPYVERDQAPTHGAGSPVLATEPEEEVYNPLRKGYGDRFRASGALFSGS